MLKLNASYSKKVPVDGQDYSSQSYHAAVEVELPDGLSPQQLQGRIHETFELVKTSVEAELHGTKGTRHSGQSRQQPRQFAGGDVPSASGKQLGYLRDIAIRKGMTLEQLDDEVNRRFGVDNVSALNRQQASVLIDEWNGGSRSRNGSHRRAA